jgi:teichuronic acid biosynthesis glycosyltransferase TuaG
LINNYKFEKKIKIFLNKKNYGPGYSRNKAIENSSGNFLAFLDSDDLWVKTKLLEQLKFLIKKNLNLCHTNVLYIKKKKIYKRKFRIPKILRYQNLLYNNYITTSSVMIRKTKYLDIKFNNCGYDDYVCWLDLTKKNNKFLLLKKHLTIYRLRNGSVSSNKFRSLKWIFNIYYNINNISLLKSLIYCLTNIVINIYKKSFYEKK